MSYPITDIEGIDGEVATVLKSVGIRSTDRLLEAARTVKGRKLLATKTGFNEKQLLCWANVADRMHTAYELGRTAFADRISLLDVIRIHHRVVGEVLQATANAQDLPVIVNAAAGFGAEAVAHALGQVDEAVQARRSALAFPPHALPDVRLVARRAGRVQQCCAHDDRSDGGDAGADAVTAHQRVG